MDLTIPYQKASSKQEAYAKVKEAVTPEAIEKFKVNADLEYKDTTHQIVAHGTGFELNIDFLDDKAEIKLTLSFVLRPLKKKILGSIEKQVTRLV